VILIRSGQGGSAKGLNLPRAAWCLICRLPPGGLRRICGRIEAMQFKVQLFPGFTDHLQEARCGGLIGCSEKEGMGCVVSVLCGSS